MNACSPKPARPETCLHFCPRLTIVATVQHSPFPQVILPALSSICHLQQDNCVGLPASAGLSQSDLCDILPVTPEITPNALQRLPTHLEKFHDTNGQVTEKGVNPLVCHHGSDQPSLEMASAQLLLDGMCSQYIHVRKAYSMT